MYEVIPSLGPLRSKLSLLPLKGGFNQIPVARNLVGSRSSLSSLSTQSILCEEEDCQGAPTVQQAEAGTDP